MSRQSVRSRRRILSRLVFLFAGGAASEVWASEAGNLFQTCDNSRARMEGCATSCLLES